MDISSVAGTASMMRTEQTRQTLSTSMIKQAADQQRQIADMLVQNAQQVQQLQQTSSNGGGISVSIYA